MKRKLFQKQQIHLQVIKLLSYFEDLFFKDVFKQKGATSWSYLSEMSTRFFLQVKSQNGLSLLFLTLALR